MLTRARPKLLMTTLSSLTPQSSPRSLLVTVQLQDTALRSARSSHNENTYRPDDNTAQDGILHRNHTAAALCYSLPAAAPLGGNPALDAPNLHNENIHRSNDSTAHHDARDKPHTAVAL
jgi:phage-related tail fiber protein